MPLGDSIKQQHERPVPATFCSVTISWSTPVQAESKCKCPGEREQEKFKSISASKRLDMSKLSRSLIKQDCATDAVLRSDLTSPNWCQSWRVRILQQFYSVSYNAHLRRSRHTHARIITVPCTHLSFKCDDTMPSRSD